MTSKDGKPCTRCGTSEWNPWRSCKECARNTARQWVANNPARKKASDKKWQCSNPAQVKERNQRWRNANLEQSREIVRVSGIKWRANNPDKQREACRRWNQANTDRVAIIQGNRRARAYNAGGSFTEVEWGALCERYGRRCLSCRGTGLKLTADHIVPLSQGGSNSIENIQPLCKSCNSRKRIRTIDFRESGLEPLS